VPKKRRPTKPTRASQTRRVDAKKGRSQVKAGRGKAREATGNALVRAGEDVRR
jgi:ribosome-associated protein